ncbi:hypothetical protein N7470_009887 [Penicillium chermesinum]|nr:hypothetical protein N7470_009887 [Penicillium chermesinum]
MGDTGSDAARLMRRLPFGIVTTRIGDEGPPAGLIASACGGFEADGALEAKPPGRVEWATSTSGIDVVASVDGLEPHWKGFQYLEGHISEAILQAAAQLPSSLESLDFIASVTGAGIVSSPLTDVESARAPDIIASVPEPEGVAAAACAVSLST